jgi:putative transposase
MSKDVWSRNLPNNVQQDSPARDHRHDLCLSTSAANSVAAYSNDHLPQIGPGPGGEDAQDLIDRGHVLARGGRLRGVTWLGSRDFLRRLRRTECGFGGTAQIGGKLRQRLEGRERLFRAGARPDPATVTRYVQERRDTFGVEPVCRAIGVPVSTFYARRSREPSRRELEDRRLVAEIYAAREGYRSVYGVRKTWKELKRREIAVGRDRVARLMRAEGLEGFAAARRNGRRPPTRPRSSGRAISSSATSPRPGRTRSGWPTSPICARGTASSTSPSSSTATAAYKRDNIRSLGSLITEPLGNPGRFNDGRVAKRLQLDFQPERPWRGMDQPL